MSPRALMHLGYKKDWNKGQGGWKENQTILENYPLLSAHNFICSRGYIQQLKMVCLRFGDYTPVPFSVLPILKSSFPICWKKE